MSSIVVTLAPEREKTRLLMADGERDLIKAVLPSPSFAHPRAAATLLEGLSLWHQTPLSVVLVVDESDHSSGTMFLSDALGFGEKTIHYEVAVACRSPQRRHPRQRIDGIASFSDLRRHRWGVFR
jgi:hypothetical protein